MKKITFLFIGFLFLNQVLNAQFQLNGSFEQWETKTHYEYPDDWFIFNDDDNTNLLVEKSNDFQHGIQSVKINTIYVQEDDKDEFGAIIYGIPGDPEIKGLPFSELGDFLHFWYKCDIQTGDMGMMWLMLYKNGVTIDSLAYPITGTNNTWTHAMVPVNPSQQTPDSMFLAFLSSVPDFFGGNPVAGSWILIDNIYFTLGMDPTPILVPNYSFENWSVAITEDPEYWETSNSESYLIINDTINVEKVSDANTGTYAAKLSTIEIEGITLNGEIEFSQAIDFAPEKLFFYYKYFPNGADTAHFNIEFLKNNNNLWGFHHYFVNSESNYSQFFIDINLFETPDEVRIRFESGDSVGTYLIIDDIAFSCSKPGNLLGIFTSSNTGQLSWSPGSIEDEWLVEWGLYGFNLGSGTQEQVFTNPVLNLTGISDNNTYQFYVKSICGVNDESSWAGPFTICKGVGVPIFQDFENTMNGHIPLCWNKISNEPMSRVQVNDMMNGNNNSQKYLEMYMQQNLPCYFVSPQIDDDLSTLMMSFYGMRANWSNDAVLKIGTMSNPSNPSTFNELATYQLSSSEFHQYEYYFNLYQGTDKYIAFFLESTSWNSEVYIDDISINLLPTCIPPVNITATNITTNSADINWQAGNNELLWNINYGEIGFDPNTGGSVDYGIVPPYNLSSLQSGTSYDVYLQSDCDMDGLSSWKKFTFITNCGLYNVPLNENFDNTNYVGDLPNCWSHIIEGWGMCMVNNWGGYNSPNAVNMRVNNYNDSVYMITPQLSPNINELFIDFYAYIHTGNAIITMGTITNPSDASTFTALTDFIPGPNYTKYQYLFNTYTGNDKYIAFRLKTPDEFYTEIFIDNIGIYYPPTCIQPLNIVLQNATPNSMDIAWDDTGNPDYWNLIIVPAGDPNWQMSTPIVCNLPSYTATQLSMGTNYDIYIQSSCGVELSTWTQATFSTQCTAFAIPILENFESTLPNTLPNCWNVITANGASANVIDWHQGTSNPNSLRMFWHMQSSTSIIISPEIINPLAALFISFNARSNSMNNPIIALGTMSDPNDENTFSSLQTFQINPNYEEFSYTFDTYTGNDNYIALKLYENNDGHTEVFIDDILIDTPPSCFKPTNINANPTSTTADVTWQEGANETLWNLIIAYQWENNWLNNHVQKIDGISQTQYLIENLSPNNYYSIYLQSDCGSGDLSQWTQAYNFFTLCDNVTAYYNYNFDDVNTWMIPQCWQNIFFHSDMNAYSGLGNYEAVTQPNHIYIYNSFGQDPNGFLMMVTPMLEDVNDKQITFQAKASHDNTPLHIGHMSNQSDPNSFQLINSIPLSTNYTEYTVPLNSLNGNMYIAFSHGEAGIGSDKGIYIDNFVFEYFASCPKPANLSIGNVSQTSVDLMWMAGGNETSWDIEIGNPFFVPGTSSYLFTEQGYSNTSWTVNGLNSGTAYEFYVKAICGIGDESIWAGPYSFSTLCGIYSTPFNEDFEVSIFPPNCWEEVSGSGSWQYTNILGAYGNSSASVLAEFYHISGNTPFNLITFEFDASQLTNPVLTFDYAYARFDNMFYDHLDIMYSDDGGNTYNLLLAMPGNGILNTAGETNSYFVPLPTQWATQEIQLPTGTNKILFKAISGNGNNLYIDNISVEEMPTCPMPIALNVSNITQTTAYLEWSEGGNETLWNIEIGYTGFTPGNFTYIENLSGHTDKFYSLTNLSPFTNYSFYVQADCGGGELSTWAGPYNFTTLCNDFNLPFIENFSTTPNWQVPSCWERNVTNWLVTNNNNAGGVSPELVFNGNLYTNNGIQRVLTPLIDATAANSLMISFKHAFASGQSDQNTIGVQVSTDGTNWTTVWSLSPTTPLNPQINEIDISTFIGEKIWISWFFDGLSTDIASWNIDNINIDEIPTCPKPTDLNVNLISGNEVELFWIHGGTENEWQVEYNFSGFMPGQGLSIETQTNSATINNLLPNTMYSFYVRAICAPGDTSNWSGPFEFTTPCGTINFPFSEFFDAIPMNNIPDCWDKIFSGNYGFLGAHDYFFNTPPYSLLLYNGNTPDPSTELTLITPKLGNINQFRLRFLAKSSISSSQLIIGTISDPDNISTFAPFESLSLNNIYEEYIVSLSDYTGPDTYIAFRHGNPLSGNGDVISIDDFHYEYLPSCPEPIQLSTVHTTPTTAIVQWTETGNAYEWQIEWGMQGFILGNGISFEVTQNQHEFFGLTTGTAYDFYVRAICNIGDTSIWAGPYTFTPEFSCINNTVYGQPPNPVEYVLWSAQEFDRKVHQNFYNINSVFDGLHFWGRLIDTTQTECYSDPINLEVSFYTDNFGDIGTPLTTFIVPVTPDSLFNNGGQFYEFTVQFPQIITMSEGWFSVQSVNSPTCYLLIANTTNPNAQGISKRVQNQGNDTLNFNPIGYCFINNSHIVNYNTSLGGYVSGQTSQYVLNGAYTTAVTAIADPCYQFVQWSDGITQNPRTDGPVYSGFSATAQFSLKNLDTSFTATICQGDTFYLGNQILTTPGDYNEYFMSDSGCDSTVYLTLIVNPSYLFTENHEICSGETYTWRSSNLSTTGLYYDTLLTEKGCDSIYVLNLIVHDNYEFITYDTICDNDNYFWRNNPYAVTGTYYDSLLTQYGCDSVYVLNLTVNESYQFVDNDTICNGDIYTWRGNTFDTAGIYYDSLNTINGCDSVYVLNLIVNDTYTFTTLDSVCNGTIYTWRNNDYTISGTYYDSLLTHNGCDSIYVLQLIVNDVYEFITIDTICDGENYLWRNNNYMTQGTYYDSLQTQYGCDSIFVLNLIVNDVFEFITYDTICDGAIYTWRNNDYTISGTYYDSLLTQHGCDSIYVLELNVNPVYELVTNDTICDGIIYTWRNNDYTIAGVYYDSLLTSFGCDSVFILNLMVNPTYSYSVLDTICDGEVYTWQGNNYTTTGTYYDSLLTVNGCDSIFILHLFVNNLPVVNLSGLDTFYCVYNNQVTLIGSPAGGTFSGEGVSGNVFNPANANIGTWTITYTYTDSNLCTGIDEIIVEVSECSGISEKDNIEIKLYPNPNNGNFIIELNENTHIGIYNTIGTLLYESQFIGGVYPFHLNHLANGIYFIKAENEKGLKVLRVIIQK